MGVGRGLGFHDRLAAVAVAAAMCINYTLKLKNINPAAIFALCPVCATQFAKE